MDPRLHSALRASLAWYDDVFALHGRPSTRTEQLWSTPVAPPPLHSAAKTLVAGVSVDLAVDAVAHLGPVSIADSFGDLDLAERGFELLIDAVWVHHPPMSAGAAPAGWAPVRDEAALALWQRLHGTPGIFLPAVLDDAAFTILGRYADDGVTGGLVLHQSHGGVTTSHGFAADDTELDPTEVLALVGAYAPGCPITDYVGRDEVHELEAQGYTSLGPQRVWLR